MATLNTKIANFINKAQTKIRELAKLLISNFDRQGYQSADSEDLLLKLYETRNFIELLNTTDRGGMTDKEINDLIDFFWKWLELNKVSFVNYPNLTTNIQDNIIVPSGTYALQADLVAEIQNRTNADASLEDRIEVLEGFDPDTILPPGFFDNQNASNVNVWDDDPRLHTHANKVTLDGLTAELLTALQALQAHYASIGEPNGVHVSTDDRNGWNAKVTTAQLNALSTVYAPLSHAQAGPDKHSISQITGLNDVINQLNTDISNMAGSDGREIELQSPDGDLIQWRYVGDPTWIDLGNFKGDEGEAGDPFTVDFRGPSAARLSSAFDGEDEGFAYLETDTGYLYFRNPAGGPATSSAGWKDPIRFVGDNGWSPVLAVFEVSSSKAVFEIVDWVGGSGIKPVFDPGLSPPDPVRWFIGPAGVTLETSVAVNIRGPQGFGFGPIIGDAGSLAGRDAHDDKSAGFIYLQTDVSPQVVYIKNTDTSADWGGPYAWQGTVGASGPPGSGLGKLINQAAHGLSVFTAVSFRGGAYVQFDSALDDVWLGVITAVGSSSLFTFVQAGYVSGLSGLVANTLYFVQNDGTISTVDTGRQVFFAISTTEGYVLSEAGQAIPNLDSILSVGNDANGQDIIDLGSLSLRGGEVIDVIATGGSDVLNIGTVNADVINIGHAGSIVNVLGTAVNFEGTQHYIEDKLITLNKDGSAASGVGAGIEIEEGGVITGYIKTNATRDGYTIKAPAVAFTGTVSLSALSADRVYTLPNATGTIALFTDITAANAGAWSLANGGTFTGPNTFTGTTVNILKFIYNTLNTTAVNGAGIWLTNNEPALNGAQQISPGIVFEGQGFAVGSGLSKPTRWKIDNLPVQGIAANPTSTLRFSLSIDGGAYSDKMIYVTGSGLQVTDGLFATTSVNGTSLNLNSGFLTIQRTGSFTVDYIINLGEYNGHSFNHSANVTEAANAVNVMRFNSTFAPVSGSNTYRVINIIPTYSFGGTNTSPVIGIHYNPSGAVLGVHTAIQTESGGIIFSDGGTKIFETTRAAGVNKIGFFASAPVAKATALTAALTQITHSAPGTPDYNIQDLVAATGFGFVTADEAQTFLSVVKNLQVRVDQAEAKLQAYGLFA